MRKRLSSDAIALISMAIALIMVIGGLKIFSGSLQKEKQVSTYKLSSAADMVEAVVATEFISTIRTEETTETELQTETETYRIVEDIKDKVVPYDANEDAQNKRKPQTEKPTEAVTEATTAAETVKDTTQRGFTTEALVYDSKGNVVYTAVETKKTLTGEEMKNALSGKSTVVMVSSGNKTFSMSGYVLKETTKGLRDTVVVSEILVKVKDSEESSTEQTTDISTEVEKESSEGTSSSSTESASESTMEKNTETVSQTVTKESTTVLTEKTSASDATEKETEASSEADEKEEYIVYELIPLIQSVSVDGWYTENGNRYYYYNENSYATGYTTIGYYKYYFDDKGKLCSKAGIDVSRHQGAIDWTAVKNSGAEFAIIRACVRGYQYAKLSEDDRFEENVRGASAAGLQVGAYVFSQAINEEEAIEEASLIIAMCKKYNITGPLVIDVEEVDSKYARQNKISVEQRTNIIKVFDAMIRNAGYTPMLYSGDNWLTYQIDTSSLTGMDFWVAKWSTKLPANRFRIWQYSECGRIPGISTDVDLNIWITD